MGFEEIPHTADWAVHVWANDLPSLLMESARAMNALAGIVVGTGARVERSFEFEASDEESMLVSLLSELLYLQEQENLAFVPSQIQVGERVLSVRAQGAPIASVDKLIKAVTWHNLEIHRTRRGLEVQIVFDV